MKKQLADILKISKDISLEKGQQNIVQEKKNNRRLFRKMNSRTYCSGKRIAEH